MRYDIRKPQASKPKPQPRQQVNLQPMPVKKPTKKARSLDLLMIILRPSMLLGSAACLLLGTLLTVGFAKYYGIQLASGFSVIWIITGAIVGLLAERVYRLFRKQAR